MKNLNVYQSEIQKININDVIVPDLSRTIYDYSNRESEITALVESISMIGQRQPIVVLKDASKYLILDGVLRYHAAIHLNLNEIDALVCEFPITDEFTLSDLIIHHQIQKQKTNIEKLNEVKTLLRIDSEDKNPLRDKEKRVTLISSLLGGKGWRRNNVLSLENILRWEKKTSSGRLFSDKVISNEITVNKALEAIKLIDNPFFSEEREKESQILTGYLKGDFNAEKAAIQ